MNACVIVAAGRGTRMGAGENKVFLRLAGEYIIVRTLRAMKSSGCFSAFVVVTGAGDVGRMQRLLRRRGLEAAVVPGGSTRQESVRLGLAACPRGTRLVAIHDGARPLVSAEVVSASLEAAGKYGSGIAAVPVKDTVKRARDGVVVETPPREMLFAVQTPQSFDFGTICDAHTRLAGEMYTDDAALLEALGTAVHLSQGSYDNLKITTPEDLIVAGRILAARRKKDGKEQA